MPSGDVSEAIRAFTGDQQRSFARDPKQEREIVPIDEFLSDPYYTGSVNSVIYPFWREKIIEFMKDDKKYEAIIDGSTSSGKCILEDSKIVLESGEVITMEEFVERGEERIQSLNEETGELVWSNVNDHIDSGVKPVYKVKTRRGYEVKVTSCHPFKTPMDGWKSIDDGLEEGDQIGVVNNYKGCFGDVEVKKYIPEFVGLMVSEGSNTKGEANFSTGSDEILEMAELIASDWGLELSKHGDTVYSFVNKDEKGNFARKKLREFGLSGEKSEDKSIPDQVFKWKKEHLRSFIEVLWSGDGYVSKKNDNYYYGYGCASEDLIDGLKHLLLRFGIRSNKSYKDNEYSGCWRIVITGEEAWKFSNNFDLISDKNKDLNHREYSKSVCFGNIKFNEQKAEKLSRLTRGVENSDKYERVDNGINRTDLENYISQKTSQSSLSLNPHNLKTKGPSPDVFRAVREYTGFDFLDSLISDDIYYDEIKEIEYVGEEQVYDLEIEGTHNFVANNIVVHNTWSSILCLFYKFYILSCFEYPQRLFGMSDETRLGMYYFNVKKKIAKNTGYQDLRGFFNESRYFQNETKWDKRKRNSIELPEKNLIASFGANESDIKGINLLGIVLDETNFFKKSGSSSKADLQTVRNIYTDAIDRITQRFHTEGSHPGLAMVISSATEDDSFLEERKKATGEHIYYVKAVNHKVDGEQYSERFWVFGGTQKVDPCILQSVDHLQKILDDVDLNFDISELDGVDNLEEAIEQIPTDIQDRFDNPPEEWRNRYEYNIESALQNRSGIPTGRQGKLFTNQEKWDQCEEQRPFPFHSKSPELSTEDGKTLESYFKEDVLCNKRELLGDLEEWMPKVNPDAKRYVYSDMSATTDPSGISMVHVEDFGESGSGMSYPFIYVDFMLQLTPPEAPARLDHDKILDFVGLLKNKYMFDIKMFGTDSYAGETVCQRLNKNVFEKEDEEAVVESMDQDDKPWMEFTRLLYKGFIRFGNYDIFRKEFMNLDHERADSKVDHPDEFPDGSVGTKDVADSVVGATTLAMDDEDVKASQFPDSADEILEDEVSELIDSQGNVNLSNWRGRNNEMPFKSKEKVMEDKRDEEIIDLL